MYPTSEVYAEGKPYDGSNRYVMHFNKGGMPPVDGFWLLTMHDAEYFFVDNPLNRYTLSARGLRSKPDLTVVRIRIVEPAARIPKGPLIPVSRETVGVFQHPRHVQKIPRHERGVAIGEIILRSA